MYIHVEETTTNQDGTVNFILTYDKKFAKAVKKIKGWWFLTDKRLNQFCIEALEHAVENYKEKS